MTQTLLDAVSTGRHIDRDGTPLLEAKAISKTFLHVQALDDVSFRVYPGETVALVGDNGAGKSTLMKILCGAYQADAGTIEFDGQAVHLRNAHDAVALGIAVVFQDLALVNHRDVACNVFLGREPKRGIVVDKGRMIRESREVLQRLKINIPSVYAQVGMLSGGQRQAVAIARAVQQGGRLIFMDEPTAALGVQEQAKVLKLIEDLQREGTAIVVVSHNLQHVFHVADRIVVMRGGRNAGERVRTETTQEEIVQLIVGAKSDYPEEKPS
ncbi:MAG: sugar ABC transporter ATP-binding protein [Thermomicrobiales bacterium]|jgi:ABC-type sugar transport system ATPase subunit|nr:sugar ABC transporter ATP-binding protein [Thermomicrobiales bacterium]